MYQIQALSFNLEEEEDDDDEGEDSTSKISSAGTSSAMQETVLPPGVSIKEEPEDQELIDQMAAIEKQAVEQMFGQLKGGVSLCLP